jgi:hypothetical protein
VPSHHHQRLPQPPHTTTTTTQAQAGTKRMRITAATATPTTTTSSSSSSSPSSSPPAQQEGLRSLLGLVVDQVREMRRENERLHDTIAQLRATQDEMRLEADQRLRNTVAELRAETARRLARVEADHHHHHHQTTINSRQLALMRIELGQQKKKKKKIDDHLAANTETPEVGPPTMPDVAQFIAQTLPFLRSSDYSSLILRDLRYTHHRTTLAVAV